MTLEREPRANDQAALEMLKKYFFSGAAEEEQQLLNEIFIGDETLRLRLRDPNDRFHLIVGLKGVGKSALLLDESFYANQHGIGIFLKPDDFEIDFSAIDRAIANIKRQFYRSLLSTIATALGEALNGKLTDYSDYVLRREALAAGGATPDLIEKLSFVVSNAVKMSEHVDFGKLVPNRSPAAAVGLLYRSIERHCAKKSVPLTVCIDDTDQFFPPDDPAQLNRLWGVLLAARELANKLKQLRIVISLRTSIWARLQTETAGQLDQIDHIKPHVINLHADDEKLTQIFERRIEAAARSCKTGRISNPGNANLLYFFDSEFMQLPESKERRLWRVFLTKNARNRPRDLIHLVRKLLDSALAKKTRITERVDEKAIVEYSAERFTFLNAEYGQDCQPLVKIIEELYKIDDETDFETLRRFLETLPSVAGITVRGKTLRPQDKQSFILLLGILFETGVYSARIVDRRQTRGFDHISWAIQPDLVSDARWGEMQGYRWEIHPAYRSQLHKLRREHEERLGRMRRSSDIRR